MTVAGTEVAAAEVVRVVRFWIHFKGGFATQLDDCKVWRVGG